jgi:ATP-binding cassette subfamily C protein CydCD
VLAFVFPVDWLSGLVLLLTAPLIPLFMLLIGNVAQALTRRQWTALSRMNAYFLDVIQGLTTLKILGRSRDQVGVIAQVNDRFRQTTMGVLRVTFLSALVLELVSTLSTAVVAVEVGLRLLYGRLPYEQALFILILAPEFYLPIRQLGARFHASMSGVAAANRIFEILASPEATPDKSNTSQSSDRRIADRDYEPAAPVITFNQISFAYPEQKHALQNISFQILPGNKVILVGPSGAGKSTIARLLLGFLQPESGSIHAGVHLLSEWTPSEWRKRVAYVSQMPYLFNDTIAANLRLAKPDASLDEMLQATKLAHLDDFILSLPQGYDTPIGERGARLSGGQAQRLALARAFLKDAPVLILDEATANLDPQEEAIIQDSIKELCTGRSVLIIAHRLSTVINADQILVLDQGRIVARGTHPELLSREGVYRRMVESLHTEPIPEDLTLARRSPSPTSNSFASAALSTTLPGNPLDNGSISGSESDLIDRPSPGRSYPSALLRLLRLALPFSGWVVLSALAGVATVLSGVGLIALSAYLLSAAALQPSIAELQVAIVGVRFFGISRGLFRYAERNLSHEVTFRLLGRIRETFYRALEPLAPARLYQMRSGDLLARIQGDIALLENFYVRGLAPPLVAVLVALAISLWLSQFDPLLVMGLAAAWLAIGIGLPAIIHSLGRRVSQDLVLQRAALSAILVDSLQGITELMVYDQEKRQQQRFLAANRDFLLSQRHLARLGALQNTLAGMIAHLGMWIVLLLVIPLVSQGKVEGVYLATLVMAALASFEAFTPLPQAAQVLGVSLQSADRLFAVVDARAEVSEPAVPASLPDEISLRFEKISFAYPTASLAGSGNLPSPQPAVLSDLSFDLPARKKLAIVGASGSGKSTLAALLLRFWEMQSGTILIGEQDIRSFDSYALRNRIGLLPQQTYVFAASLKDNLLLAQPKASQAQIEQAVRAAHLDEFIQSLPQGYATWIGEQGVRLSAGERQRLAIARLLLKDASLLLLDEPSASLDAMTERAVLQNLLESTAGRSLILITHRLVHLECFDEILVLQQGKIIERGSYHELIHRDGPFRQMWTIQNQVFA